MIVFDLRCEQMHVFEAWFGSTADFEDQAARGLVSCPLCGATKVEKAVMAPAVGAKGNQQPADAARKEALRRLAEMQAEAMASCDYVGARFAEEARARHEAGTLGAQARGIMGEASLADAIDLIEDGIPVAPLPFRPRRAADA